jgi:hypothetical protein
MMWIDLSAALEESKTQYWIRAYNKSAQRALTDKTSWLNQDQGVRAVLNVYNDIFYSGARLWQLGKWRFPEHSENETTPEEVDGALASLANAPFRKHMRELAIGLASFDWRSVEAPGVKADETLIVQKRSYRGSGGYSALRADVLQTLADEDNQVGQIAADLIAVEQ